MFVLVFLFAWVMFLFAAFDIFLSHFSWFGCVGVAVRCGSTLCLPCELC